MKSMTRKDVLNYVISYFVRRKFYVAFKTVIICTQGSHLKAIYTRLSFIFRFFIVPRWMQNGSHLLKSMLHFSVNDLGCHIWNHRSLY